MALKGKEASRREKARPRKRKKGEKKVRKTPKGIQRGIYYGRGGYERIKGA